MLRNWHKFAYGVAFAFIMMTNSLSAQWGDNYCCEEPGPLRACGWGIQLKGGVAPSHFTERGSVYLVNPSVFPPVYKIGNIPSFNRTFDTPWELGAELTWNACDHVQFFLEGVYTRADGKRHSHEEDIRLKICDYKTWGGYLGTRYYFCRWCDQLALFLGAKAGFVDQHKVKGSVCSNGSSLGSICYFKQQTAVSAGLQLGLDWRFCDCWSLVLTGEAVWTQGPKASRSELSTDGIGAPTHLALSHIGKVISYPVTLGVRFEF